MSRPPEQVINIYSRAVLTPDGLAEMIGPPDPAAVAALVKRYARRRGTLDFDDRPAVVRVWLGDGADRRCLLAFFAGPTEHAAAAAGNHLIRYRVAATVTGWRGYWALVMETYRPDLCVVRL